MAVTLALIRERVKTAPSKGIPIGNLTSQIFANIYMNEFDQFMKHDLNVKHYARYTDDFIVVGNSRLYLENPLPQIETFLQYHLDLKLHPNKVSIQPSHRGVDFLGYIIWVHHRVLRTKTHKRMLKKLAQRAQEYENGLRSQQSFNQSLQSYLGVLSHANTYKLTNDLKNRFWVPGENI